MNIDDIRAITLNPSFGAEILIHFLSGCKNKQIKFELVFLAIPFIMHGESRNLLINANSRSSINSLFLENSNGVSAMAGIEELYKLYKPLTQKSLLIACNSTSIVISDNIKIVSEKNYKDESNDYLKKFYKAAFYLGLILTKMEYLSVFSKLQIRSI